MCDLMLETGYGTSQSSGPDGDISVSFVSMKKRKNASATGVAATKRLLSALHVGAPFFIAHLLFST